MIVWIVAKHVEKDHHPAADALARCAALAVHCDETGSQIVRDLDGNGAQQVRKLTEIISDKPLVHAGKRRDLIESQFSLRCRLAGLADGRDDAFLSDPDRRPPPALAAPLSGLSP